MATVPPTPPEYEFGPQHSELIRDLARKMGLVGLVFLLFGALQVAHGILWVIASRNPQIVLNAAQDSGVPQAQVQKLEETLNKAGFATPLTALGVSSALGGLVLVLIGVWTQQSAGSFAAVANTSGQDVSRLMGGLASLRKIYALQYYILLFAALFTLVSFVISLWYRWGGN